MCEQQLAIMGNTQADIYFGAKREQEPEEYEALKQVASKFHSQEEKEKLVQVKKEILSSYLAQNQQLCEFVALACLRFRRYDVASAIERMTSYFTWRIKTMGDLNEQDISEGSQLHRVSQLNLIKLLPELTDRGQSIMYLRLAKARPDLFEATDVVKLGHYTIMAALKRSPISQVMGIVTISDLGNAGSAQVDREVPKKMIKMVSRNLPLRLSGIMIVHPNFLVSIILPIAKLFMSAKMASRLKVVSDNNELCDYYGIKRSILPKSIGGEIEITEDGSVFIGVKKDARRDDKIEEEGVEEEEGGEKEEVSF